jgi:hypothetical protein
MDLESNLYIQKSLSENNNVIAGLKNRMTFIFKIQWNLCNPTPEFSNILRHLTKIYGPKVFLLTEIKPEYSYILYNLTHFPGPLVCRIGQVPLYS